MAEPPAPSKRPPLLTYEAARALAQSPAIEDRQALAERGDAPPEILYYLVADPAPSVRRGIASNPRTPAQAHPRLARDGDGNVREELARKIGRLLPDLAAAQAAAVREATVTTLETLAEDRLPRVRAVLAEAIKDSPYVPKNVALRLARDLDHLVSVPILEHSPLLDDADLRELIAGGVGCAALSAIARRRHVPPAVSDAVVATFDVPAIADLLANPSATIRAATLDTVIDRARDVVPWHEPLAFRPDLSVRAARRIAGFVASALVRVLAERHGIGDAAAAAIGLAARQRIAALPPGALSPAITGRTAAEAEVDALAASGRLDERTLLDAVEKDRRDFAHGALAYLAGLSVDAVLRVLTTRSASAVMALAWRAGLSPAAALQLQLRLARLPPQRVRRPRDGLYPLDPDTMSALLDAALAGGDS
jgi:uncharacterized protein (DUF2336 family)